jgi:2-oxoglutarate dehydrogenase E2 component (dihydrolipoamide succinyltransferase)
MKMEIKVPSLGESLSEAQIGVILKPSGSSIQKDDELLELETEKVNQVLYAPGNGIVTWNIASGDRVQIGQVIGFVSEEAEESVPKKKEQPSPILKPSTEKKEAVSLANPPDIDEKVDAPSTDQTRVIRKRMSLLRKTIAERLVQVKNQTAMLTTFNEVDLSQVVFLRQKHRDYFLSEYGIKLGFMSFFVKAAVSALQTYPEVNSSLEGEEIFQFQDIHIGIAVSTDRGLMVPVLRNCDTLSSSDIEKKIDELAEKARLSRISIEELQGGTFTITNGGRFGSLLSTPMLNPPQSAILGMHAIVERPVAIEKKIEIRPMMYLALSYDHRLIDGKEAILFLSHIKEKLEKSADKLLEI